MFKPCVCTRSPLSSPPFPFQPANSLFPFSFPFPFPTNVSLHIVPLNFPFHSLTNWILIQFDTKLQSFRRYHPNVIIIKRVMQWLWGCEKTLILLEWGNTFEHILAKAPANLNENNQISSSSAPDHINVSHLSLHLIPYFLLFMECVIWQTAPLLSDSAVHVNSYSLITLPSTQANRSCVCVYLSCHFEWRMMQSVSRSLFTVELQLTAHLSLLLATLLPALLLPPSPSLSLSLLDCVEFVLLPSDLPLCLLCCCCCWDVCNLAKSSVNFSSCWLSSCNSIRIFLFIKSRFANNHPTFSVKSFLWMRSSICATAVSFSSILLRLSSSSSTVFFFAATSSHLLYGHPPSPTLFIQPRFSVL